MRVDVLRILIDKELRQLLRSPSAAFATLLAGFVILLVTPVSQMLLLARLAGPGALLEQRLPVVGSAGEFLLYFLMPFWLVFGSRFVPMLTSIHTLTSERDQRTTELLVALPVSLPEILHAKLIANLLYAGAVCLPPALVAVGAAAGFVPLPPLYVAETLLLLALVLAGALGVNLMVTLLTRDIRASGNLNGLLLVPTLLITVVVLLLVPIPARLPVLGLLLFAGGALCFLLAVRWISLERYVS